MKKLAIITTHPIQYYAPVFKLLYDRQRIDIKVFYTLGKQVTYDTGFGKIINWDIPLLTGYPYKWIENTVKKPDSHHFMGIKTPDLINQIKTYKPDAILIFGWAYHSHLSVLRYFNNRVPVYFRGDSTLLNEPAGIKKILKYFFLKWVYKHVDHAFYVGQNNKAYFKKYGLKETQLSFAPHAVDNTRFKEDQAVVASELRASLKIKADDILVLYAGKFDTVKNIPLLLSAFIKLKKQHVHLLLAGDGINEISLRKQADESSAAARIHFTGFKNQSHMPALYQAADLFCLPSRSETWGLSINEAMACNKAILASDGVGSAIDLVKTGINGYIFKNGDIDNLFQLLEKMTDNKATLIQLGIQSGNIIKNWNFTNIAEAIEHQLLNISIN